MKANDLILQHMPTINRFIDGVKESIHRVEDAPPSVGYEPMLREFGMDPFSARFFGYGFKRWGIQAAHESDVKERIIPAAIRKLAQSGRRPSTIARIAANLVATPGADRLVSSVFGRIDEHGAGQVFAASLGPAAAADLDACRRLTEIARSVTGQIPIRRGRRIRAASVAHAIALDTVRAFGLDVSYTRCSYRERFVDPVTQATIREFGDKDFDPRPAVRRLRRNGPLDPGFVCTTPRLTDKRRATPAKQRRISKTMD